MPKKWGIAEEIYLESMERCLRQKEGIPQWYVLIDEEGNIAAGAGMIDNDFHSRKDLTPQSLRLVCGRERYREPGTCQMDSGRDPGRRPGTWDTTSCIW